MSQNKLTVIGKNDKINVKNFDNIDEFNDYYKLHESEINEVSTVKLNKMFKIKDFKIVRRKIDGKEVKTLCFQQVFKNKSESNINDESKFEEIESSIAALRSSTEAMLKDLNDKIKLIEVENSKIKSQLIEIIKVINNSSN